MTSTRAARKDRHQRGDGRGHGDERGEKRETRRRVGVCGLGREDGVHAMLRNTTHASSTAVPPATTSA